jgi:hypothetical protein
MSKIVARFVKDESGALPNIKSNAEGVAQVDATAAGMSL